MKKYIIGVFVFILLVVSVGLWLGATWWTVVISAAAFLVALFTLMWHLYFYECDFGKLIVRLAWRDDNPGKGLVVNVINGGHKPITPIGINWENKDGKKHTLPDAILKPICSDILLPGGRIQTLIQPIILINKQVFESGLKKFWVKDMFDRDFFADKSNLDKINEHCAKKRK